MDSNTPNKNSEFNLNNDNNNNNDKTSEIELQKKNNENNIYPNNQENSVNYNTIFDQNQKNFQTQNTYNNTFTNMLFTPNPSNFNEPLVNQEVGANEPVSSSPPVMEPIRSQITDEDIKRKNCKIFQFYMAYHCFMLLFVIPLIVIIFNICSKLKYSEYYYFQRIHDNWTKPPISKITTEKCEEFDKQLIQNYWEGTTSGCNCYSYIKTSSCGRKSACRSIKAIDPMPISYWRGRRLCRETSADWEKKNYFDLNIEKSADNCSTGTRSCGIIDTLGSHLCVEAMTPCPVNSIRFYDDVEYDKVRNSLPKDVIAIQLTNGYLVYGNNPKNTNFNNFTIPIEYKVSDGMPCLNPFYENIKYPLYLLDANRGRRECLKYTDDSDNTNTTSTTSTTNPNDKQYYFNINYNIIDTISQEVLYTENGITAKTYNLPLFSKNQYNHETNLYATNYFGLKPSCYKDIKRNGSSDEVLADLRTVSEIVSINLFFLRVFTITYMIIFVIVMLLGTAMIDKPKGRRTLTKIDTSNVYLYACLACIAELLIILLIFCLISIKGKVGIGNDFVKVFSDPSCVDKFTIDLYTQLVPDILYVKSATSWGIFLGIVIIALYIVFFNIGKNYTMKGDDIYRDD